MTRLRRISMAAVVLGLFAAPALNLCAQSTPSAAQRANIAASRAEHMDAGETNNELDQYTHSPVVQSIARHLHISTDVASEIFEDINSGIVLLAIVWFLWKALPRMFRTRSEKIANALAEAQRATEAANKLLAEVEARLMRLDSEIEALRVHADQDAAEEEKRIRAALESERQRIVTSAEQEIAAAQAGAQRELKKVAADLAIDHAMRRIQLTADTDRALVKEFGQNIGKGGEA